MSKEQKGDDLVKWLNRVVLTSMGGSVFLFA